MRLVLLLALVTLTTALSASAQSVNWVQYINPTNRHDTAFGVCLFGDYVAVVGSVDNYTLMEFVALLDKATGEVVKTWVGERGVLYNCLSASDRLYVVGWNRIYIFDRGLNVIKRIETNWVPNAIMFDGNYLYLAGGIQRDVDGDGNSEWVWRIEKRTQDFGLVTYKEYYREWNKAYGYFSIASDIAINPMTGDLWVVGSWNFSNRTYVVLDYSLLVIFDKGLNVERVVEYPHGHENYLGWLYGICFDEEGDAYVVSIDYIAKFDKSGNLKAVYKKNPPNIAWYISKIACVGGRVYVFGTRSVGDYLRHVLDVFDEELNLLRELILSKGVETYSGFGWGRPAFDGRSLYVAGNDNALGESNSRIVVYSIPLPWPIKVVDEFGRPMPGVFVEAVVSSRSFVNWTGEDGVAWFSGVVPEKVYVYDWGNFRVGFADGKESRVVVRRVGEVRVANSVEAHGYAVFKGQFLNGTVKSLVYEVVVSGGAMRIQRPIPIIYPVEVYIAEVSSD